MLGNHLISKTYRLTNFLDRLITLVIVNNLNTKYYIDLKFIEIYVILLLIYLLVYTVYCIEFKSYYVIYNPKSS